MKLKNMEQVFDVCSGYDYIISDIWGVVHDGIDVFNSMLQVFEELKQAGKHITLLSNSPLPSDNVIQKIGKMGITSRHYDNIYTSGQLLYQDFQNGVYEQPMFNKPFGFLGEEKKFFIESAAESYTNNYQDGQTLFILSVSQLSKKEIIDLNKHILNHNITVICGNGDICVFVQGEKVLRPGFLARLYKAQGVKTVIYGKPDIRMYEKCHELINHASKDKILMIGDMYETDIIGASQFGIDALHVGHLCQPQYPSTSNKVFSLKDFH